MKPPWPLIPLRKIYNHKQGLNYLFVFDQFYLKTLFLDLLRFKSILRACHGLSNFLSLMERTLTETELSTLSFWLIYSLTRFE